MVASSRRNDFFAVVGCSDMAVSPTQPRAPPCRRTHGADEGRAREPRHAREQPGGSAPVVQTEGSRSRCGASPNGTALGPSLDAPLPSGERYGNFTIPIFTGV